MSGESESEELAEVAGNLLENADVEGPSPAPDPAGAGDVEAGDPVESGGIDQGMDSFIDRAMSTEPNIPLDSPELDSLFDPENGGFRRVNRGIMKFGGFDSLPAIADVGIGLIEEMVKRRGGGGGGAAAESGGGFDPTDPASTPQGSGQEWMGEQ